MTTSREVRPVTVVVADDEPIARLGLRRALDAVSWVQWVGEAASGDETVAVVDRLRPDLLFLDIAMPGGNGLDALRRMAHRPHVVFTTAFAEHAVTAFEVGGVDYLLKPFGADRLGMALERVRAAVGAPVDAVADRLAEVLGTGPMARLFVRSGPSVIPVAVDALIHLEAWGDYVVAHTASARHVVHVTLQALERRLDPAAFVRVHRGHLVRLDAVRSFRTVEGALVAELSTGVRVPVSRTHARSIRRLAR
jgi:two-component system LytT family response regulator